MTEKGKAKHTTNSSFISSIQIEGTKRQGDCDGY